MNRLLLSYGKVAEADKEIDDVSLDSLTPLAYSEYLAPESATDQSPQEKSSGKQSTADIAYSRYSNEYMGKNIDMFA
jgi:hypothetical protein